MRWRSKCVRTKNKLKTMKKRDNTHFKPIRMATIKNKQTRKQLLARMWRNRTLVHC